MKPMRTSARHARQTRLNRASQYLALSISAFVFDTWQGFKTPKVIVPAIIATAYLGLMIPLALSTAPSP
jgi:hypothetical protein